VKLRFLIVVALLTACETPAPSASPTPEQTPLVQGVLRGAKVGVSYRFDIVTALSCGLRGANVNGDWWVEKHGLQTGEFASEGYDRPIDSGTIRLLNRRVAKYESEAGVRFTFVRTTQAAVEKLPACLD
jgi:hypothetical protein